LAANAVDQFAQMVRETGYRPEAVVRDYAFADVMAEGGATRTAPLVAFTRTPPSYRSAALAVVEGGGRRAIDLVQEHRALGAPLLFVIELEDVTVWQVRSHGPPRSLEKVKLHDLKALFERNRKDWHPDAIHRAKAVGIAGGPYQLDFVDAGLLPAIEGEVHLKLDRLLVETLDVARRGLPKAPVDARTLFRVVFRLLAAKVLQDRGHPYADGWNPDDLASVLGAIEAYYNLGQITGRPDATLAGRFEAAWRHLRDGISFSNISADDLAFVYENTLVTPETRKLFGTHSTPRQVAEYVVQRLELHRYDAGELRIYEPFAGAGVFLVSALRHLRDLLSVDWTDQQRHDFLIDHISGDEIDPFACEVATLSLILADYPNHNGWHVREADLFADGVLADRLATSNVVICNPPFEAFTKAERTSYGVAANTHSKAIAALSAALDAKPLALGFVLPRSFILDQQFAESRRRIEQLYGYVEILKLPDGIFGASHVESAAVIARDLRAPGVQTITLRSTEVSERDRASFLKSGQPTIERDEVRSVAKAPQGQLWLPPLREVWDYLRDHPKFGSMFATRRGLEWRYDQALAARETPAEGYRLGYANARHLRQYQAPKALWLDFRREQLRCGAAHDWTRPKIIASATRLSRGPWCLGAFADLQGLLCSQQFFALRPRAPVTNGALMALTGVLNGPVANAFLAIHSPKDRFRTAVVDEIPAPRILPEKLAELVNAYVSALPKAAALQQGEELTRLLAEIDAAILEAYDLPLHLERQLMAFFDDAERPTLQPWKHWDQAYPGTGLSLSERMSGRFYLAGNWVGEVFQPLPGPEAALLRDLGA
jgi:hypothetical protein